MMWKKNCRAGQATDDNIIWRMRFVCSIITTRTQTHAKKYLILTAFPWQQPPSERA